MKILQINNSDSRGGASTIAASLHLGLLEKNITSHLIVQEQNLKLPFCQKSPNKIFSLKYKRLIDNWPKIFYCWRKKLPLSLNYYPTKLLQLEQQNQINYDILHLHWINEGMFNLQELKKVIKPVVFTLHDAWIFTGGCHLPFDCQKFSQQCGCCPQLKSLFSFDPTYKLIKRKKQLLQKPNFYFITPSEFLKKLALKSFLLAKQKIITIPNGVDSKKFYPSAKQLARKKLNLPVNKKILLFNGSNNLTDYNKNFIFLQQTLPFVKKKQNYLLIILTNDHNINLDFPFKIFKISHNNEKLNLIYNASDVVLLTSLWENFSLTVLEGSACKKPSLAFNVGGVNEIIQTKKNGVLITKNNHNQFIEGLEYIFTHYDYLANNAYQIFQEKFTLELMVKNYIDLYQKITQ